jgi:hypothetical protein
VIPEFDNNGNLPSGIHNATMEDVEERYCYNERRSFLFLRLKEVVAILRGSNCPEVFLDGSFITAKSNLVITTFAMNP